MRTNPQVSPDGTRLAWIAPHEGTQNIWVGTLGLDDGRPVTATTGRGVQHYRWWPNGSRIGYLQDPVGNENWQLCDVDPDSGRVRELAAFPEAQAQLVDVDADLTDRVLVALNLVDLRNHDVYEIDLASGHLNPVLSGGGLTEFVADRQLRVRAAIAVQPDGGRAIMVRDPHEGSPWRCLLRVEREDAASAPVGFSGDGCQLLVRTTVGADTVRLVWIEVATGATQVIAEDGDYDLAELVLARGSNEPLMVGFQRERLRWQALTGDAARDLKALETLDDGDFTVVSRDHADRIWIVAYGHADGATRYFAYYREDAAGVFLFEDRPELSRYRLSPVRPFMFAARDEKTTIHGYLTFPTDRGRRRLPTVLLVHGGPWKRDTWRFNPVVQLLADRGYLVVQPQFRGSTGYGKAFHNAGDREWGGLMQDDLVDAVAHVVEAGYADQDRIAIVGASYGGYAALAGVAFTPGLYRCAIDLCGPSNLATLIEATPPFWAPYLAELHARVGNPAVDGDMLRRRSPLFRAAEIQVPVLIGQGAQDVRVPEAESERIVAVLRAGHVPVEYLVFPGEGHTFVQPDSRVRFWGAAEAFLARYLGGLCTSALGAR